MAPNPRVAQAFRAMRVLGIKEEVVKPVLKKLLKLYEKNWELIEEENYRALADAIFDQAETQEAEQKKNHQHAQVEMDEEAQVEEEPERPLKRLRLRYHEGQPSPSLGNPTTNLNGTLLKIPKEEEAELPETRQSQDVAGSSQPKKKDSTAIASPPITRSKGKQPVLPEQEKLVTSEAGVVANAQPLASLRTESDSISPAKRLREKGKEPLLPQVAKKSVPVRSSRALCLKEPVAESGTALPKKQVNTSLALIKPKDEPCTDDTPLAIILPEPLSNNNASRNGSGKKSDGSQLLISQSVQGDSRSNGDDESLVKKRANGDLTNAVDGSSSNLEIASLASGEVKISLTCNSAVGRPDFHMPSIDEVLKTVENKCLKSFKVLDPSFSLTKLMKDVCECFLELGSDSTNKSQETIGEMEAADSSKKLAALDATGIPLDPSNGPVNSSNAAEAAQPEIPVPPPSSSCCMDDCAQRKTKDTDSICEIVNENDQNRRQQNSLEVVVPQNQPLDLHDDVNDIAKGQEKYVISFVNEVNNECPPSFHYIPQNVVFQNAYVNFNLARIGENCCSTCSGNCLSSPTPCACVHETDGDFPYTLEGLIKEDFLEECISMNRDPEKHCQFYCKDCPIERAKCEDIPEPCKGHLMRKFIKECWWKCGCSKHCGNRVVQRGINCQLQVFMTPEGKGWGLRTLSDLPKGAFVCEYVGEILTNAELFERNSQPSSENHSYPVLLDADWGSEGVLKDEEALCLDATHFGNVARFINHRCFDSNMVEIPVEVETPDHHYYHLAFFTTRKVQAMEELTWDYGIDFDDHDHPVKAFKCHCGSKFCRNIKRSSRGSRAAGKRRRC